MSRPNLRNILAPSAAALACTLAQPAFAQDTTQSAPVAQDGQIDGDIVVTAQFREQRLQDTPIAITAMDSSVLEARSQQSVQDIGNFAPNVNLSSATSLNGNAVNAFIRGVGQADSSFALEPGVGMYIDDVYYGTTFGAVFDLTDLDRVEVLRGPQGTLAGKNSVGGAVKLFSKKPDGNGGGYVEATYGAYNRMQLRASADFAIGKDFFARVSGTAKSVDGFMDILDYGCANPGGGIAASPQAGGGDCKIGSEGGQQIYAGRLALRYAPEGSPFEINVIGDVAVDKSEAVPTKLRYANQPLTRSYDPANPLGGVPFDSRFITGPESYTTYATYSNGGNYTTVFGFPVQVVPGSYQTDPVSHANSWGVSGTIDYQISDSLSIKSITAYRKAWGRAGIDIDGSPETLILEEFRQQHEQFTQELRLSGKVGTFADFTVGGFYYDAHDVLRNRIHIPMVLLDFLSDDPVDNSSKSVFGHLELHPFENFNIVGGLRYTSDEKTYTFSRRNPDGTLPAPVFGTFNFTVAGLDGLEGTYSGDRVDYRIGANYRFSPALMVYAQVSTGFKGGGVNPRPYVAAQVVPFGPETLTTYEAGFKADLFDRAFRLNGAFFLNKYKDMQLTLLNCASVSPAAATPCSLPANAGDADVQGFELEATVQPVHGLTIDGSVGYLDFDYTSVNAATGITLDMRAPFMPEWQASGGIQYRADLGDDIGTLTPRLDWAYTSAFFYNSNNAPLSEVAGRSIFNARLTYETADREWSLSAAVTNLTDKFYYVGQNENVAAYGVSTGIVGRPREWMLSLRKNF